MMENFTFGQRWKALLTQAAPMMSESPLKKVNAWFAMIDQYQHVCARVATLLFAMCVLLACPHASALSAVQAYIPSKIVYRLPGMIQCMQTESTFSKQQD